MTFVNHGCNGTSNLSEKLPFTESNANFTDPLFLDLIQKQWADGEGGVYNPAQLRATASLVMVSNHVPIRKGEELLDDYINFITDVEMLEEGLTDLKTQCAGESFGIISEYESSLDSPEAAK